MRTSTVLPRSAVALTVLAALFLTGCAEQGERRPASPTASDTPTPGSGPAAARPTADVRIEATNSSMLGQSFHASGTTTAFPGATQETWSDPRQGLHMKVTGQVSGDIYCKDGTSYTSAPLLAAALRQRGQSLTVPDRLLDTYVTSTTVSGCDMYYRIPETVQAAPAQDRVIDGKRASAFETPAGSTQDVYFLEDGKLRLIQVESSRAGRTSTTTYDAFGEKYSIEMPAAQKTMTMEQFRAAVNG
ncbi:hypothetical protein ACFYP6_33845 [Streptomyces goshikiensis]|uniref:hypothetical protein n=1 Tax=Streptomyces goshikiensis TaxID=1942 RepID=UPI0036C2AB75